MKKPSVTVLVTVKNSQKTIEKCVSSLLKLNYKNYKIFVTDAYSTDGTWEILNKLKKRHPKKIKLEQVKGNIAKAHNYMIRKVNTKFIAMTDADCVVSKNWLKNLMVGFTSKDIIAAAGFCSTPKRVNKLQRLIGSELEHRLKRLPKFIPRGPTMNLAVRTKFAKKVKFDERFDVVQETDWGYTLTEFGKMVYVPNAIVYHYHRPTPKTFFKQQFKYAKRGRLFHLFYKKHKNRSVADPITTGMMIVQECIFFLLCFFFIFLLLTKFFIPFIFFLLGLIFIYFIDIVRYARTPPDIIALMFIYFLRNVAWSIGLVFGIFDLIFKRS